MGQNGAGKKQPNKLVNDCVLDRETFANGDCLVQGLEDVWNCSACLNAVQNPDYQICKEGVLEEVAFGLELRDLESAKVLDARR